MRVSKLFLLGFTCVHAYGPRMISLRSFALLWSLRMTLGLCVQKSRIVDDLRQLTCLQSVWLNIFVEVGQALLERHEAYVRRHEVRTLNVPDYILTSGYLDQQLQQFYFPSYSILGYKAHRRAS